jgi:hypothetical protein
MVGDRCNDIVADPFGKMLYHMVVRISSVVAVILGHSSMKMLHIFFFSMVWTQVDQPSAYISLHIYCTAV